MRIDMVDYWTSKDNQHNVKILREGSDQPVTHMGLSLASTYRLVWLMQDLLKEKIGHVTPNVRGWVWRRSTQRGEVYETT